MTVSFDINMLFGALKELKAASDKSLVTMRVIDGNKGVGFSTEDGVALLVMPVEGVAGDACAGIRTGSVDDAVEAEATEKEAEPVSDAA